MMFSTVVVMVMVVILIATIVVIINFTLKFKIISYFLTE